MEPPWSDLFYSFENIDVVLFTLTHCFPHSKYDLDHLQFQWGEVRKREGSLCWFQCHDSSYASAVICLFKGASSPWPRAQGPLLCSSFIFKCLWCCRLIKLCFYNKWNKVSLIFFSPQLFKVVWMEASWRSVQFEHKSCLTKWTQNGFWKTINKCGDLKKRKTKKVVYKPGWRYSNDIHLF